MLNISDLNQVIKHFAYQVQQRIDDLDRLQCLPLTQDESAQSELLPIISKYHNYVAKDEKQNKLAHKLVERILQIFDFFRAKSKNQNLLSIIHHKIKTQLSIIIDKSNVNIGELFSYIRVITKPNGIIKVPAQKRRVLSKSILREPAKIEQKISPTLSLYSIQKRGTSLSNFNNKRIKTMSLGPEKWKMEEVLSGIWNCLEVQRLHLNRVKQGNQQQTLKQMLRRNQKILQNIRQYERKWRSGVAQPTECSQQRTILSQIKSNVRNAWTAKRKKMGFVRKQNSSYKENMSIII